VNVHALPDLRALDAKAALEALTERARKLKVFGTDVDFDGPVWNLSSAKRARPSAAQTTCLYFTRLGARETRSMKGRTPFQRSFADLVKSLIAMREFSGPANSADIYKKIVQSARYLHETVEDRDFDPASLTSEDFTAAANAAADKATATREAHGDRLEEIATFINKHGLSRSRISFHSDVVRIRMHSVTNAAAQAARQKKMPSEEVVDAVIAMSNDVRGNGDDRDVLRASVIELLMCAPWRINELLSAQHDCLCKDKKTDPQTGERSDAYGIRHDGSKGADDTIKWLPTPMVDVGLRALADIRRITQLARDVAKWMEEHPGRAYLAEPWRLASSGTLLTTADVAAALGLASKEASTYWLSSHDVPRFMRDDRYWCRLDDLEAAILACQPQLPPGSPPLSEYLFLVPQHFFRTDMGTVLPIITFVGNAQINYFLTTSKGQKSVFERLGITDEHDQPYRITSHGFRHYLNTIAQDGCLSQLDIARWSGRKRIEQNAAYDHTGGLQFGRHLRTMVDTGALDGSVVATAAALPPLEREGFLKARFNTAHMTDIGACVQDWSMAPCPSHGACAGCGDHLVIKGNTAHKARAERLLAEHEAMLSQTKAEMDEGTPGASNWVAHNEKMVAGLRRTIAVHANPQITDGTVVQL
jgi:hypothetical protein